MYQLSREALSKVIRDIPSNLCTVIHRQPVVWVGRSVFVSMFVVVMVFFGTFLFVLVFVPIFILMVMCISVLVFFVIGVRFIFRLCPYVDLRIDRVDFC